MVVGAMLLSGTSAGLGIPKSPSFHSGLELAAAKNFDFLNSSTSNSINTNQTNNNNYEEQYTSIMPSSNKNNHSQSQSQQQQSPQQQNLTFNTINGNGMTSLHQPLQQPPPQSSSSSSLASQQQQQTEISPNGGGGNGGVRLMHGCIYNGLSSPTTITAVVSLPLLRGLFLVLL